MTLRFADEQTRADLGTYVSRARRVDADGAMRLQATGDVLAAWVGVLGGHDVSGSGTTLGLRVLALAQPAQLDVVVPTAALADRFARTGDGTELEVPPAQVRAEWTAISPPRAGWQRIGALPVSQLETVARQGIEQIAQGSPKDAGAAAVQALRRRVWDRSIAAVGGADGLRTGVAFAAHALGFLVGDSAEVYAAQRWHRLSTPVGHVLVR